MFKSYFFILLCLGAIGLNCTTKVNSDDVSNATRSDSTITEKLKAIDKPTFIGRPVGVLLSQPAVRTHKALRFIDEPPGVLQGIDLDFLDGSVLQIRVAKFKHVKKFSAMLEWPFEEFKKEEISSIELVIK